MSESRSLLITTFRNNFRGQLHIKEIPELPKRSWKHGTADQLGLF